MEHIFVAFSSCIAELKNKTLNWNQAGEYFGKKNEVNSQLKKN